MAQDQQRAAVSVGTLSASWRESIIVPTKMQMALAHRALPLLLYGLVAAMILAAVALVQYRYPVSYIYFILEDGVAENSTAIALALAAFLLIWEVRRARHPLRRSLLIALAAAALFVAGEEISWGQRIFGFNTPESLRALNLKGELNVHNLPGVRGLQRALGAGLLIWLAVSIVLSVRRSRSDAAAIVRALPLLQPALAPLILLTAWILLFLPFVRFDEMGEWLFGLSLLAWAINLVLDGRARSQSLVVAVSLGALAGVMLLGAGLAAAYPPQNPGSRFNNTAEALATYGLYEQAEQVFEFILAHPQYVQPETQANYEAVLDRKTP